jgi:hypothetical protein
MAEEPINFVWEKVPFLFVGRTGAIVCSYNVNFGFQWPVCHNYSLTAMGFWFLALLLV